MTEHFDVRLITPHPGQQRIHRNLRRFNHCRMGRRWGKTVFGIDYLLDDHGGMPGAIAGMPVAWFAPTNKLLADPWRDAKQMLQPLTRHKNEVDKRIELVTGGSLEFWTMDVDDPARGRKYAKVVVDEAATVRRLIDKWQQSVAPTLTDYRGGAFFASTPKGRNDFWRLEQDARRKNPDDWAFFHAPTADNPYISPQEIEFWRREQPTLVFRQEYLAEYVDFGGAVLRAEWIQAGAPDWSWPIVLGVDLAISTKDEADYTAIVALCRSRTGHIYVMGAQRFRATFHGILQQIIAAAERFNPVLIVIENNQFQAAVVQELLRTTKLNVRGVRRDKDKLTAFAPVAARYEQGLIYHVPGLPAYFADELLAFTGTDDDDHEDMVDAMSTAYLGLPSTNVSVVSGIRRETALQVAP